MTNRENELLGLVRDRNKDFFMNAMMLGADGFGVDCSGPKPTLWMEKRGKRVLYDIRPDLTVSKRFI